MRRMEVGLRRRRLGVGGPEITTVGLGTWALGGPGRYGWGPVDDAESIGAIRRSVESGVNWIDTAPAYGLGHAEEIVRRALDPWKVGEEVYVFTKCGLNWYGSPTGDVRNDLRPQSIRFECEQSLRRLGVERIDLYQFHWPDPATPVEDSWGVMVDLLREGKVRWAGVSNFDVALLDRCEAVRHVDSCQPKVSLIHRDARGDVIPWCREHDTGVIAYSPLGSGLLTGAFSRRRVEELAPGDWRRRDADFQDSNLGRSLEIVDRLKAVASRLSVELPALAVAWVLAIPGVTGAICGARRQAQVDGWLPASRMNLEQRVLVEVERIVWEAEAGG
jgi:aryl-alcohol dehydrogenase-like predicted oxidoreductase